METEAISSCIGPLSRDYLSKVVHHVAPCTNLHKVLPYKSKDDHISVLLARPFPYVSTVPAPLTPLATVERSTLNGLDPTISLIREKVKWQTKKEKILKAVTKDSRNITSKLHEQAVKARINGNLALPQGVVLLGQHLDKDPDKGFSGVYNWYYTGGTLSTLSNKEDFYLLHASHSTLNCSKLLENEKSVLLSSINIGGKHNERIYEVSSNMSGAAVRQKSKVTIVALVDTGDKHIQINEIFSVTDNKKPFLSTALKHSSLEKFCTLSNGGVVKVWDVEYAKASGKSKQYKEKINISQLEGVTVTDSWSNIQFVDNRTLLVADRSCVHLLDLRTDLNEVQQAWNPRSWLESCEQLSYLTPSPVHEQIMYTLTTHQALGLDLRHGFYQRWTHMLTSPPYIGFAQIMPDNQEVLCVGSQVGADCVAIVNSFQGEQAESLHNPKLLPAPTYGLHLARQQGLCLDPTLTQRCTQSQTGMTYLPAANGIYVVRQTATADVFIQHLTMTGDADDTQLTDRQLTAYADWSRPTLSLQREPSAVRVTEVADLSNFVEVLSKQRKPTEKKTQGTVQSGLINAGSKWQVSKTYLEDCVDLLAGKMLDVWEVEEEEEWAPDVKDESFEEQDSEQKVSDWLHTNPPNSTVNITGIKPSFTSVQFPQPKTNTDSHLFQPNPTTSYQNITALSSMRPTTTSTPFLPAQPSNTRSPQEDDAWPWMTQPSQIVTPRKLTDSYFPSPYHSTPPSSGGSSGRARKRQKLFNSTSPKKPTSAKKPVRLVKKSVPGF